MSNPDIPKNLEMDTGDHTEAGVWPPPHAERNYRVLEPGKVLLLCGGDTLTIDFIRRKRIAIGCSILYFIGWLACTIYFYLQGPANYRIFLEGTPPPFLNSILSALVAIPLVCRLWEIYIGGSPPFCITLRKDLGLCTAGRGRFFLISDILRVHIIQRIRRGKTSYLVGFATTVVRVHASVPEASLRPGLPLETQFDIGIFHSKNTAEQFAQQVADFAGLEVRVV